MKYLLCLIYFAVMYIPASAQDLIYVSKWKSESCRDIIIVDSPCNADVCINVVDSKNDLHHYKNAWFFVKTKSEATRIVRIVTTTNGNLDAVRVFFYKFPTEAVQDKWVKAYGSLFDCGI